MKIVELSSGPTAASLRRQELHRAEIALRVETILGNFWREDTASEVRACEVEGWVDVLESSSQTEIRMAWATYQRTGPRTESGRLAKPDAGALWRIIMAERPLPTLLVKPKAEPPRRDPRVTLEAMERIMREVGWRPLPRGYASAEWVNNESHSAKDGFRSLADAASRAAEKEE